MTKQGNQFVRWFFTFNNYEQKDILKLRLWFNIVCDKYIFQEETGSQGTKHLQGSVHFKIRKRLTEIKDHDTRIHWEPTKNSKRADEYCCKEETRTGEVYSYGKRKAFERTKSKFDTIEPREEIINIIEEEPDNRTINWVWSEEGGMGKTSTCAYIEREYEGVCVVNGAGKDIKNTVISHISQDKPLDILIVNVPRCNENHVSYSALEEIKDGLIYSGKYEGGFANIEHPHVIVICNFMPDRRKLSDDRWNIVNVDKKN